MYREGCKGCVIVPKQPSMPFWSILQGGLVGEGVDVEGADLCWSEDVRRRSEAFNTFFVCMFDFSRNVPLNLQVACAQVCEPRMPTPLTLEQQADLAQDVGRRKLWCDLTESTVRVD